MAPDASLEDGLLDVVLVGHVPRRRFVALLPTLFRGEHVHQPNVQVLRSAAVTISADRPFTMYADGDPDRRAPGHRPRVPGSRADDRPRGAMSATLDAKVIASRAVGRLARRAGRGGGTSLPGKVLTRLEPHAIARLAGRLPHGSAVISATNGKTTTAAMTASVLERSGIALVHNRAGANMAGGVASDAAGRGRPGERDRRRARPVRGRRVLAGPGRARARAAERSCWQPVPRPARPLRRARDDRRPLGRARRRPARHAPGAQRRRSPDRRPGP